MNRRIPPYIKANQFYGRSMLELAYIIKDAGEAAKAFIGERCETKYLDQVNDACTMLHYMREASR